METTLLTIKEVAGFARVHPITVRRWILRGKLSSMRIGGVVRISMDALLDFLEDSLRRGKRKSSGGGEAA